MLHNNIIQQSGFRFLNDAELDAVSGGWTNENDTFPGIDSGSYGPQVDYFRATGIWVDNPVTASGLLAYSGGGGFGGGEGGSGGYQGEIVVTPGPMQQQDINGQKAWVVLNHEAGTFVEYAVGETNPFGAPIDFYPVGTGIFHSERTEAWSINLPFVSIPVTTNTYVLERDRD